MDNQNTLLTIGQFAALHGINKKTLMWYDQTGLFHPAFIHPGNGYRYYSYRQSSLLETILLLRELDVPVSEIQTFVKNRSAASLSRLLKEQLADLDQTICHLQSVRRSLASRYENMETLLTMDLSEISVIRKEEHCLVTVDIDRHTPYEKQVEMITAETRKYQLRRLHDASYGTMIAVEHLYNGNFSEYGKLFIEIPYPIQKAGLHIQPGGNYVKAFFKGNWDLLPQKYEEILRYAQDHHLALAGFSYEMVINEAVIHRMEDSIVQIEIPVRPRRSDASAAASGY